MSKDMSTESAGSIKKVSQDELARPKVLEKLSSDEEKTTDFFNKLVAEVKASQEIFATFTSEKVDEIFKAAALAANKERIPLAKEAVHETGMGIFEDKVIKNHFASEFVYNHYKNTPSCGLIEEDAEFGIKKYAEPLGVIAGVVPTTNPTSTTIFKALLALKTRNGIIFSPHPRAKKCTVHAARVVLEAAIAAGAPKGIIGWIEEPTVQLSQLLMQHPDIAMILATGGPAMVKAAYSSGKPALGVGAGNTPVLIDETADIPMTINNIIISKTFDNGMICASEQALVVHHAIYDDVVKAMQDRGVFLLEGEARRKLGETVFPNGRLNARIVGQPAMSIAKIAGIVVPDGTRILMVEAKHVSSDEVFSFEKLSPVLAIYKAENFDLGVAKAAELVEIGGLGHTSVLHINPGESAKIDVFQRHMKTGRVLVNMPASQGAIGDVFNFCLPPSMTLGCGSWGGNSASENIGIKHLLNIKTVAERRENMQWFRVPPKIYFKRGSVEYGLKEMSDRHRAFVVTCPDLYDLGMCDSTVKTIRGMGMTYTVYRDVQPDPALSAVKEILETMIAFAPDIIIAVGGGSPMDAAKVLWLMYEQPQICFEDLAMSFMDIRKRIVDIPDLGKKAAFVAIPTTSGTGSEVTPFTVITDDRQGPGKHIKYPIADYALTPTMALIDPHLVQSMPRGLAAASGIDALTHALEAYVSVLATPYTNGLALEAIDLIFEHLSSSVNVPHLCQEAREQMHYAATIAGMAFANAFLGICHSMAHKLGSTFQIAHGVANALLICQVIRFNANNNPEKMTAFPQYKFPNIKKRYVKISRMLGLGRSMKTSSGDGDDDMMIDELIQAIEDLKSEIGLPKSIQATGIDEASFFEKLDDVAMQAFDDQCTGANPVYPLVSQLNLRTENKQSKTNPRSKPL
jgi:acetaldehyde dehydrogenase / alcohol dehydrogenase